MQPVGVIVVTVDREPPITLTTDDYKTLSKLADLRQGAAAADDLAYELDRVRVVPGADEAPSAVRIGFRGRFCYHEADEEREVVLVMPNEADIGKGFISVLIPVGVALLGLAVGQVISFTVPSDQDRSLRVVKITPSRAGWIASRQDRGRSYQSQLIVA
jgi:regulator of nucleoside diphosphate kinase